MDYKALIVVIAAVALAGAGGFLMGRNPNPQAGGFFTQGYPAANSIGTSTPLATFQVTAAAANATTSLEIGKANQNKGTCITYFDTAGTAVYGFIAAGATSFTYSNTEPSGCQI